VKTRRRRPARPERRGLEVILHAESSADPQREALGTVLAIATLSLFGVALLFMALGPHRIGGYGTETDFYGSYAEGARQIQRGVLDPSRYGVVGPIYELALAGAGLLARDLFLAAELLSAAAAVATLLLWFVLLRRRHGAWIGLFAIAFMATNPTLFHYGYSASTDALALALQAGALCLLFATSGPRTAALAGLVAALAFLTRYTAVTLLPAGLIATLARGRARGDGGRKQALAFAAGFLAPVGTWIAYSLASGTGFAFQLHHNLAFEVYARPRGIPWDAYQRDLQPGFHSLWDVIARDPAAVAWRLLVNCGAHLAEDARLLLGWPVAAAVTAGLVLGAWSGALRRAWPLAATGVLCFLSFVPVFYSDRYSLALLPFYAALAAYAFASPRFAFAVTRRSPAKRGRGIPLKTVLALVPLALSLAASVRLQRMVLTQQPTEALDAGRVLRALAHPGERVIARKPQVAYLGGIEALPFPFAESLQELAAYARVHKARWLFYGWPEVEARPWYRHLIDTTGAVPGLTVRYARMWTWRPGVLYEIGPAFGERPSWYDDSLLVALHDTRVRLLERPGDADLLALAGVIELDRGLVRDATEHLERAADRRPTDPHVLLPLGQALLQSGDPRRASIAFTRAEQVSPGNLEARLGRGWASLLAGQREEAASLWRPVIGLTRDAITLERMAALYQELGDDSAAAVARAARRRLGP